MTLEPRPDQDSQNLVDALTQTADWHREQAELLKNEIYRRAASFIGHPGSLEVPGMLKQIHFHNNMAKRIERATDAGS